MSADYQPRKAHRKPAFLKAFTRIGTIAGAARASRISRDAVHDWLGRDPSFAKDLREIRSHRDDEHFEQLQSALIFFQHVARQVVPAECMPRLTAELALAIIRLKSDLKGSVQHTAAPSEIPVGAPAPLKRFGEVAVLGRGAGAFMENLL